MTTFTSGDREEAYKKILEEAPNQPGYEDAVPIPPTEEIKALEKGLEFFKALKGDNASPPHIVDSGASVMKDEPVAYINVEERKLEWAKPMTWHTPTIAQMDKIPLYIIPNNEPVAWMVDGVLFTSLGAALNISFDIEQPCIPLYTHSAKTLTDEEILEVKKTVEYNQFMTAGEYAFNVAKAVLRKAQEK